uniref:Uncharacterized protein LOC104241631 n=1 Tax=Nicotiana sylvestris TaxID=4096 RepID=A0A1U7XZ01_NICSY
MWSDSTVVLGWINSKASNYHTFVANRISDIQQITSTEQWKHVRSEENPADLISRGLTPKGLINNQFWFYGPRFLHGSETMWPPQHSHLTCALELRQRAEVSVTAVQIKESLSLFNTIKYNNSLRRLQRIMAYVLRFISATQQSTVRAKETGKTKRSVHTRANVLLPTATEMDEALKTLVKISQEEHFAEEMKTLHHEKCIKNDSHISSLTPFIDNNGILRVGGRLQASLLSYDAKHPMLLPYHHSLTKLIFETLHKEHLHVGAQTLLAIVRQRFWPLKGKNIARATIQGCLTCTKAKPRLYEQLMGTLPKDRVQPSRPFINAGVDFFGPVWVHFKLRGKRPLKSYVAVFCCFATKAVHLELVSDLTTDAFLGALRRFMSRRGHCNKVYCDNATNFVGAKNQLCELNIALFQDNAQQKIQNECSKKNIQFSFIPPRAPHFGGLWEAAVKSAKHLLQSTIAAANLTHEEMETLIVEAEAIMNSRPLTPMSSDPNDLTALTPGHFLIGEPLTATPDPHALDNNLKPLARWKLVTHLKSEFWKRWTSEYLHSLQHRYKWKKEMHDIQPDTMVLIKEDNLPSFKWSIGRIQNVIKGDDGLVR